MVAIIPVQPLNRDGVVTVVEFSRGGRLRLVNWFQNFVNVPNLDLMDRQVAKAWEHI